MTKVTVVGLGYVGMPLATAFANKGFDITGYDVSENAVRVAREGIYPTIVTNYQIKPINATTKPEECLPFADFIIICVPTPITKDKKPDLNYLKSAAETVAKYLKK